LISEKMKKTIRVILIILVLAGIVSAGFFYFQHNKKISPQIVVINTENKAAPEVIEKKAVSNEEIKILFLGDMMFDRYIRQVGEKRGYDFIFQGVDEILKDNDLVVGNLEGPITENKSVSVDSEFGSKNNYIFTFDPQVASVMKNHGIGLVNLGNNHILNFGEAGLEQTKNYLQQSGVKYFCDKNIHYTIYKIQDTTIGFVCYNQFESDAENKTLDDIKTVKKQADFVILYTHWDKEYEMTPLQNTKELAHRFIDAGADAIIGSHPHVVQSKEIYKDISIYYSLGNFIFDQYFDPNSKQGLAVKVIINSSNRKLNFQEYQLQLKNNGQTVLVK
jgi:gamma-polyglutamate biosynthesis protein CapA